MRLLPLLLLLACEPPDGDDVPDRVAEELDRLAERGPHDVGYAEDSVTYDDTVAGGTRTLRLGVWYPTEATAGVPATYLGPHAATGVLLDVEPAEGPWPLVVFSHGHQGSHDNASHLMAWFASHGWVAAAPEHTGNTTLDGPDRTAAIYVQRPHDVSAALDFLLDPEGPWGTLLDERVLAVGHSFGGYTMFPLAGSAWAADAWTAHCEAAGEGSECVDWSETIEAAVRAGASDTRIQAAVSLSGGNWDQLQDGLAEVDRPVLHLTGGLEGGVPEDDVWRDLSATGQHVRALIAHGDHQTCMDFAGIGATVDGFPGTHPDALAWDRGHRLTYRLLGAFARRHVLRDGLLDGVLDGSVPIDEDLAILTK